MKKLFLSLFSIVALAILVASCSQSIEIEQQQPKPSVPKMSTEEKMRWIESIVSKYHQSKGSRVASFCPGGVRFISDLGILGCSIQTLTIPASIDCGVFSFTAGSAGWNNQGLQEQVVLNSSINTNVYIIKDDGTLLAYGFNFADSNNLIAPGTQCNLVFFKTQSGDGNYYFGTRPYGVQQSCTDNW